MQSDQKLVEEIRNHFGLSSGVIFNPSSWFSYGSNLKSSYFEKKMRMEPRHSSLKLLNIRKAFLPGYKRELNNESSIHGLSYAIWENGDGVWGIIHDVPLYELANYLDMEGVFDLKNHKLRKSPRYRIIDIQNSTMMSEVPHVLTLIGIKENHEPIESIMREKHVELIEYVRASAEGAVEQGVDTSPFQAKLKEMESTAKAQVLK